MQTSVREKNQIDTPYIATPSKMINMSIFMHVIGAGVCRNLQSSNQTLLDLESLA